MKQRIYLFEFNLKMGNTVYLPIATSCLKAHALSNESIKTKFEFMPYVFLKDSMESLLGEIDNPSICGFSLSMWNYNISLELAKRIKDKYPSCLIIVGGASVPFDANEFLHENGFVDIACIGEGERTFMQILLAYLDGNGYDGVDGINFIKEGKHYKNPQIPISDLSILPSPYLKGEFDYLIANPKGLVYQAIVETNRGCPFNCGYCFWGMDGLNAKVRYFPMDRVKAEADWIAENKMQYIFCADGNFGIVKRDIEIAQYYAHIKSKTGYPEKFRVNFAKNSQDRNYQIGKIFADSDLSKSTTLSVQSKNETVLKNIGRQNVSMKAFDEFSKSCAKENIPVYTEFILGLPGETYKSFVEGLKMTLKEDFSKQIFVYACNVLPNTMLSKKDFREQHGIKTAKIPLNPIHCSVNDGAVITENEVIISETNTMNLNEMARCFTLSSIIQLFISFKLLYYPCKFLTDNSDFSVIDFCEYCLDAPGLVDNIIISHLSEFFSRINDLYNAMCGRGTVDSEYGEIYWELEEKSLLDILRADRAKFVSDISTLVQRYVEKHKLNIKADLLEEVILFGAYSLPFYGAEYSPIVFNNDWLAYFNDIAEWTNKRTVIDFIPQKNSFLNMRDFAYSIALFGKKGTGILNKTKLRNNI